MPMSILRPADWNPLGRFEWFERSRVPVCAWIVVIWAACIFPGMGLRSFHYEEGYIVAVARALLEDGNWVPHLYGWRFVERPSLMAWTVAGLGFVFGGINQWIARAPAVLSLLLGCLLVSVLVRRYASALAALFAALCFLVSPMMLQKTIVAEPDVLVSVILFATFIVWWNGVEADRISAPRWLAIGALLALAALVKGPQPIAYFGLGAGAFHLLRRQWRDIVGLAFAGLIPAIVCGVWYWSVYEPGDISTWLWHSRIGYPTPFLTRIVNGIVLLATLLFEVLPALVLVVPFALILSRPGTSKSNDLALSLLLYAVCCTAALMFWPGAAGRFAMPAALAMAALAGLAFERFRTERPRLVNLALTIGGGLVVYQIALSWIVMPAVPDLFRSSRIAATTVTSVTATQRAVLYTDVDSLNKNIFGYISQPVRVVPFDDLVRVRPPAWLLVSPESARRLRDALPEAQLRAITSSDGVQYLLELRAR